MLPITYNEHGMGEVGEAASPASPAKVQKVPTQGRVGSGEVSPNVITHFSMLINKEIDT